MISLIGRRQCVLCAGSLSVEWNSIIAALVWIRCHAVTIGQLHRDSELTAMDKSPSDIFTRGNICCDHWCRAAESVSDPLSASVGSIFYALRMHIRCCRPVNTWRLNCMRVNVDCNSRELLDRARCLVIWRMRWQSRPEYPCQLFAHDHNADRVRWKRFDVVACKTRCTSFNNSLLLNCLLKC